MATTSFSLGEHWDNYLNEKVASGEFKTKAEVMRQALRQAKQKDEARAAVIAYVETGMESGLVNEPIGDVVSRIKSRGRQDLKSGSSA